ncbi:unnamed protein product [Penicillium salamii]|nr:unnamed protein product [Penicillium salamii]CAG8417754.1 unnamed protein product [Penicillium salamii]
MVRLSFSSSLLCLSLGISAADINRRWTNGDTATGTTGNSEIEGCEYWVNDIGTGDSCETIEAYFGITKKQFLSWNPSVPRSCALVRGWSYCVAGPDNLATSTSTTATSMPAGTLTYSGTAAPTQSGVFSSCKNYYLVQDGDTCNTIQDNLMTFTLGQFYSWNPSISKGCKGLHVGYYVCVDGESSASSSSVSATPTASHQPHQTGIPSNCKILSLAIILAPTKALAYPCSGTNWHFVVKGDSCAAIASKFDITKEEFYQMNPATGSTCSNLWLSNYVCVGVSGSSSSSSVTTTGPIATKSATTKPTSTMGATKTAQPLPGTIDTCKSWHLAASGDSCWTIEQKYNVTAADFNSWNPKVGHDCAGLWLGYYVCVDA